MTKHLYAFTLLLLTTLSFAPQMVSAQTETLDIIQYTPPKGWTRTPKDGAVVFSDINKGTNAFCILTLYGSKRTAGSPQKDFANEWSELVVKPFKAELTPKTESQVEDGWTSVTAASQIEMDGSKSFVLLTVLSGHGKTASVFTILNDQSYLAQLDGFMGSISMNKTTSPVSATPDIQVKNPPTAPIPGNRMPGKFGHLIYKPMEGWKQTNYTNAVSFTPSNLLPDYNLEVRLMDSKPFSGSLQQAFVEGWNDAQQQLESLAVHQPEILAEKTSFQGWEYIRGEGYVENKNHDQYRLNLFVVKLNNRIERIFAVSQQIPQMLGFRINALQFGGYMDVVDDFMFSVKFDDWKDQDNSTANLTGGGIVGMYGGFKFKADLVNGRSRDVGGLTGFYALFFSNGQVYYRDKLPPSGFDGLNTQAAASKNNQNWGTYTLQNGKGEFKTIFYGSMPLTVNGSGITLTTNQTPHNYIKIPSVDGVVFNGTYYFEGNLAGKVNPTITFMPDGKFIDNGALDILNHEWSMNCDIDHKCDVAKESGSGTYQARNYSLIFRYSDGRKLQIAFSGLNYDRKNQSPAILTLSFNNDELIRQ